MADKYTAAEITAMGMKGQAFKGADGSFSYPIGDVDDLKLAIHAVGRSGDDHDAVRKYIIGRAADLKQSPLIPDNWNADGSMKTSAEPVDFERRLTVLRQRAEFRSGLHSVRELRQCHLDFEMREVPDGTGGTNLRFAGYACVTDADYEMGDWLGEWTERVAKGAFTKTLQEQADVVFLMNHQGMSLARTKSGTLKLSETTVGNPTGLHTEALLDPSNLHVQAIRSGVERGDLDEMSFAFRVPKDRSVWSEDFDDRTILECNLSQGDVSLVNYAANPHTAGTTGIRGRDREMDVRAYLSALLEVRAGNPLSPDQVTSISGAIGKLGNAEAVIEAREMLSALVDPTSDQSGASADDESQAAHLLTEKLAEASLLTARNREAEKKRGKKRAA